MGVVGVVGFKAELPTCKSETGQSWGVKALDGFRATDTQPDKIIRSRPKHHQPSSYESTGFSCSLDSRSKKAPQLLRAARPGH